MECVMTRRYTHNDNYIGITTSTETPMVNQYMVFTVRINQIVDTVHYIVSLFLYQPYTISLLILTQYKIRK